MFAIRHKGKLLRNNPVDDGFGNDLVTILVFTDEVIAIQFSMTCPGYDLDDRRVEVVELKKGRVVHYGQTKV